MPGAWPLRIGVLRFGLRSQLRLAGHPARSRSLCAGLVAYPTMANAGHSESEPSLHHVSVNATMSERWAEDWHEALATISEDLSPRSKAWIKA